MEGQCDVCVPQYGNLDKFCFFYFFVFLLFVVVFSGLHKVSENIQRAAKRRSITAVP